MQHQGYNNGPIITKLAKNYKMGKRRKKGGGERRRINTNKENREVNSQINKLTYCTIPTYLIGNNSLLSTAPK